MSVPARHRQSIAAFVVALAVVGLLWPSLQALHDVWMAHPYTHGYLAAAAFLGLAWRERSAILDRDGHIEACLVAVVASAVWLIGVVAHVRALHLAMLPLLLSSWILAVLGARAAKRLYPAVLILSLAVPVWEVLTPLLQEVTIEVTGLMTTALGISATIEENLVHIEAGTFLIATGCAGLNYLLVGLTLGAAYGQLFLRDWRVRAIVLGLSALLPSIGNWSRVTSLVHLGNRSGMDHPFISDPTWHQVHGYAFFVVAIVVLFAVAQRLHDPPRGEPDRGSSPRDDDPDRSSESSGRRSAVHLATLAVLAGPILYAIVGALPDRPVAVSEHASVPFDWIAEEDPSARPFSWRPGFAGHVSHTPRTWSDVSGTAYADIFVYQDQSQDAELVSSTNRIAEGENIVAARVIAGSPDRLVNEAVIRDAEGLLLVWYWYRVGGYETPFRARAKLLEVPAFFLRIDQAELAAVATPCDGLDCEGAAGLLYRSLGGGPVE